MQASVSKPSARALSTYLIHESIDHSVVHLNLGQEVIVVTEDKLMRELDDLLLGEKSRRAWRAPVGALLSIFIVFVTANFHTAMGVSGEQWRAIFGVLFAGTVFWLLKAAVILMRPGTSVKSFLDSLKSARESSRTGDELQDPCAKKGTDLP